MSHYLAARLTVERSGGFVGEDDLPGRSNGTRDGDTLSLPA